MKSLSLTVLGLLARMNCTRGSQLGGPWYNSGCCNLLLASGAYNWGLEELFLLMVVLPLLFAFAFTQNDSDLEKTNVESSGPQPPYRCKIITTSKKKYVCSWQYGCVR
jgi:hypothetical protein